MYTDIRVNRNIYGAEYSRTDQVKFFKEYLPQILLGPFLNTLPIKYISFLYTYSSKCRCMFYGNIIAFNFAWSEALGRFFLISRLNTHSVPNPCYASVRGKLGIKY